MWCLSSRRIAFVLGLLCFAMGMCFLWFVADEISSYPLLVPAYVAQRLRDLLTSACDSGDQLLAFGLTARAGTAYRYRGHDIVHMIKNRCRDRFDALLQFAGRDCVALCTYFEQFLQQKARIGDRLR